MWLILINKNDLASFNLDFWKFSLACVQLCQGSQTRFNNDDEYETLVVKVLTNKKVEGDYVVEGINVESYVKIGLETR